jgi:hypothetical protein
MTTAAELNNRRIGVDLKHMLLSDAFIVGYYNFIEGVAFETFGDTKFKLNPHLRSKWVGAQSIYETGRLFGAVGAMLGFGRIDWFYKIAKFTLMSWLSGMKSDVKVSLTTYSSTRGRRQSNENRVRI